MVPGTATATDDAAGPVTPMTPSHLVPAPIAPTPSTGHPTHPVAAPAPPPIATPSVGICTLPPDVRTLDISNAPPTDARMQDATEDLLGTSVPDAPAMDERATPTQLPYRDTAVPQLVPSQIMAVWADAVAEVLEDIRDAVKRGHSASVVTGVQYLLTLASEVLGDNRGGKNQKRRAAARVRDLRKRTRAAMTLADSGGKNAGRSKTAIIADDALAGRIYRHVRNGNDGRAARCLDSSPVAQICDETLAQLRCLHPAAPAPSQPTPHDAPQGGPAQVEADALSHILLRLPRGTAAGLSGWTYEHVRAAGLYDKRTGEAMRGFVNDILSGAIPHSDLLLASRLIALEKPHGGVRPIAIGEAFLRVASICALSTVQTAADLLAPLQVGVGIPGGAHSDQISSTLTWSPSRLLSTECLQPL